MACGAQVAFQHQYRDASARVRNFLFYFRDHFRLGTREEWAHKRNQALRIADRQLAKGLLRFDQIHDSLPGWPIQPMDTVYSKMRILQLPFVGYFLTFEAPSCA